MNKQKETQTAPNLGNLPALFRPQDLEALGIPRGRVRTMLANGEAERISRGLYRRTSVPPDENETVAMVAAKAPNAIVCLLTALRFHEIGTQSPREVWIAIDRKARLPRFDGIPVRTVRFSGPMLTYQVETRKILGVPVKITSPARTVVDCFRYRKKIGLDIALEALEDAVRSRRAKIDEIKRAAEICRIGTIIRPYLEAVAV